MVSELKSIAVGIGREAIKGKLAASYAAAGEPHTTSPPQVGGFRSAGRAAATSHASKVGRAAGKKYVDAYIAIPRLVVRAIQFILGLVAAGVYGHLVATHGAAEWVFAVAVAGLSCATAALFAASAPLALLSSRLETYRAFGWDLLLALLWLVAFAIFAATFLHRPEEAGRFKGANTATMKAMVWLDLVSAILWLASGLYGGLRKFASDRAGALVGRALARVFGEKKKEAGVEVSKV